jgi:3-oxoacyl-[acyl-carrier protein] reductase
MDLGLKGKHALVMGGGRGLGRGIAEALLAEGVGVAIVSRDLVGLEKAAAEMREKTKGKVAAFAGDLSDWASIEKAFHAAEKEFGAIDILVNNSGGPPPSGVSGVDPALWLKHFEAMVLNIMRLTDLAVPAMQKRKWGRVLTIASSSVVQPSPTLGMSNTLRSALVGWSKTLAGEVARDGITANILLPGRIATDRVAELDAALAAKGGKPVEQISEGLAAQIPLGRYGTIEEFGAVAAFLASVQASYVTGSMIRIDGGAIRSV